MFRPLYDMYHGGCAPEQCAPTPPSSSALRAWQRNNDPSLPLAVMLRSVPAAPFPKGRAFLIVLPHQMLAFFNVSPWQMCVFLFVLPRQMRAFLIVSPQQMCAFLIVLPSQMRAFLIVSPRQIGAFLIVLPRQCTPF